jgi:hypothetical protein
MAAENVLLDLLDRDPALIDDVVAETLRLTGRETAYTAEELEQLVHAFRASLREALAGSGTDARDLMIETAVPAVVAQGDTPATLARSSGVFGVLLASRVARVVPEDARDGAATWLGAFFGEWLHDIVAAGQRAQEAG